MIPMPFEDNQFVNRWLSSVSKSSAKQYRYRFKNFLDFHNLSVEEFLEEAKTDRIKTKTRLNTYYNHLIEQEYSLNYAAFSESAVKSFLNYEEIPIATQKRSSTTMNERFPLRQDDIKKYVEAAPSLRDKALIMIAYQTGMGISDLLRLNYGHVKESVEQNNYPHIIKYVRKKSSTKGLAIIGRDSVTLLRKYINWRKEQTATLTSKSPLFIANHGSNKRLSPRSAQDMLRTTMVAAGVTTFEELEQYRKYNPYGFHAIRTAFSSIAEQFMPKTCVDYSMAHRLPYNGAYTKYTEEERIELYKEAESALSIFVEEREIVQLQHEVKEEKAKNERVTNVTIKLLEYLQNHFETDKLQEIAKEILQS